MDGLSAEEIAGARARLKLAQAAQHTSNPAWKSGKALRREKELTEELQGKAKRDLAQVAFETMRDEFLEPALQSLREDLASDDPHLRVKARTEVLNRVLGKPVQQIHVDKEEHVFTWNDETVTGAGRLKAVMDSGALPPPA